MRIQTLREMAIGPQYDGKWYWHVTTEKAARQIAKDGHLVAKGISFEKGSWKPRPGYVYMTSSTDEIAYYYTVRQMKSGNPKFMGIVKIDANIVRDIIEPDEDEVCDIFHDVNDSLLRGFPASRESYDYLLAMRILESLPKSVQKRGRDLLEKEYNQEQNRRRGTWLRFAKEIIPMLKGTKVWDELMQKSRSGAAQGPIPVHGVWIVDTTKQGSIGLEGPEKFLRGHEKIL